MPEPRALLEDLLEVLRELHEPEFLTVGEAAEYVRKSPAWIYRQIARGALRCIRHGRRAITLWRPHLREFMLAHVEPVDAPRPTADRRHVSQIVKEVMGDMRSPR